MSAKTTALPVPLEGIDALEAADLTYTDTTPEAEVQAVAAPVVAAELRAQADKLDLIATRATALHDFAAAAIGLRQRADELEQQ